MSLTDSNEKPATYSKIDSPLRSFWFTLDDDGDDDYDEDELFLWYGWPTKGV